MPFITGRSGIEWNYDLQGEGENLLFIHGWGVDKRIWVQQLKYFSQFYRVLSIDLPGHGKSGWKKVLLEDMARDLKGITEELNLNQLTLIGSSLGGPVALKIF